MKKIILVLLAIMLLAPMVQAEERLSLSGQMRVWAVRLDNYKVDSNNGIDGVFNSDIDNDQSFFTQRFRLQPKITVAEGVYAHLRFDFAENEWGNDDWVNQARYVGDNELQVDRAYLEVNKEKYFIKAGQHLQAFGNYIAVDTNGTGLTAGLKFNPVTVTAVYTKEDENGSNIDNDGFGDLDIYGLGVDFAKDKFSGGLFYATAINSQFNDAEDTKSVIGLHGKANMGKVDLTAELNYFMGDNGQSGAAERDYVGTQLYLDAKMNMEKGMVGAAILYAMGTDKADETQISFLTDWGDFVPFSFGILDYGDAWCPVENGLGVSSFDMGGNAGVMAITVYGEGKVANMVILRGQLAYAAPEEDKATALDSIILINAGAEYEFATGTSLLASANYIMPSMEGNVSDDAALGLFAGVRLNF